MPKSTKRPINSTRTSAHVVSALMFRDLAIVAVGFSIVCALTLVAAYLAARWIPKKTAFAVGACVSLSAALVLIQHAHLQHLLYGAEPMALWPYRAAVFVAPALFFYFARALVLPDAPIKPALGLHLLPAGVALALPASLGLPFILAIGSGYALWLSWLVMTARAHYRQVRMERIFAALVTLSALLVLGSGLIWDQRLFYTVYGLSIAGTYAMILFALVAIPDFVNELFEQTQLRYAVSTLGEVDIQATLGALERAMTQELRYRDDSLNLANLAEQLDLSSHQLSELLNRHLGQSFSQYLRGHRLSAAKALLLSQPQQSVLSIALETGFRSQSTFYAAFKDAFGLSPGAFRNQQVPKKAPE
ncbi:MAG: helix-turn-helix domain-containing protein [Pseudomonadales bacterium]